MNDDSILLAERVLYGMCSRGYRVRRHPCKSTAPSIAPTTPWALWPMAGWGGGPVARARTDL